MNLARLFIVPVVLNFLIVASAATSTEVRLPYSLTAYWGAPLTYTDSASRACRAALAMQRKINELSPELERLGFEVTSE